MSIIITALIVIIIMGCAISYNGLVKSKLQTEETFAQIDIQLSDRQDIVSKLSDYLKTETGFDKSIMTLSKLSSSISTESNSVEKMKKSDELSKALMNVLSSVKSNDKLMTNTDYLEIQDQITESESKLVYKRKVYNATVANYNKKLILFPSNIIGRLFQFQKIDYLQLSNDEDVFEG